MELLKFMKVTFISFINSENLGDLLIVNELEKKILSNFDIERYSFMFQQNKLEMNNKSFNNSKRSNFLKRVFKQVYNDYFRKTSYIDSLHTLRINRVINNNIKSSNFEKDVASSDFIVVGGGNAIFDLTPRSDSVYKFEKILDLAEKYNKQVFITSIGVGPFQTNTQLERTKKILSRAHSITLRDKKSWDYLKTLPNNPILSIDPVFLMNNPLNKDTNKAGLKTVGVCVIDLLLNKSSYSQSKEYISNTVDMINKLSKNYKVILFSTEKKDYEAVNRVYDEFSGNQAVEKIELNDFEDVYRLYNQIDVLLGTRMHSLIIAAAHNVPFLGISWQDKVSEMFKMINMESNCYDMKNLSSEKEIILNSLVEKINNLEVEKKELMKVKIRNEKMFEVNFRQIDEIILPTGE